MQIRKQYWIRAKELLDYCTPDELKVLHQQAEKELNKRMNMYLGKLELSDQEKTRIKNVRKKIKSRRKSKKDQKLTTKPER